jgi:NADH dehydrogenase [ubiquinone] 1 alpha subcomplex assembly factor 1
MVPSFRGRKLDMPNYPAKVLEEVVILISNKKAERFSLEIDKITLE